MLSMLSLQDTIVVTAAAGIVSALLFLFIFAQVLTSVRLTVRASHLQTL